MWHKFVDLLEVVEADATMDFYSLIAGGRAVLWQQPSGDWKADAAYSLDLNDVMGARLDVELFDTGYRYRAFNLLAYEWDAHDAVTKVSGTATLTTTSVFKA